MLQGLLLFSSPPAQKGDFSVLLVVVSLIGAIGGSIGNMMYPFFITEKGWVGPRYRKVQMYDLAFGCTTIVLLDLAVWTIGAEVIYPTGKSISGLDDLAKLLTATLGPSGGPIFYLGAFVAMFSSVFGSASGTGLLIAEVVRVNRGQTLAQAGPPSETREWRMAAIWCLVTPLIWSFLPIPFVTLTVLVNALNVVVLPFLTAVVWLLTSRADLIGSAWTNVRTFSTCAPRLPFSNFAAANAKRLT